VTINQSAAQVDPTSVSPILFRVDFSEPVIGFVTGDVLLSGTALPTTALVTPVTSSVYSVEVSGMSVSGTVIASLGAGVAIDGGNNPSAASTSTDNTVQFNLPPVDNTPPTVTINQSAAQVDPTSVSPILFRVDFSEPVTGFVTGDVLLSGTALPTTALVTPVTSSVYSVEVSGMSVSGTVIAQIGAGVAIDAASNPSAAATFTDNTVQFNLPAGDVTPPTVTIDQAVTQVDPTSASPIVFTVTFSETVTGFVTGDVLLSGTANPTTAVVTPVSGTVYTVEVSGMDQSGTVIANVGAGVAIDAASNPSAAATFTDNQVQFNLPAGDVTPPTVTINQSAAQVDPTSASPIVFTVTFSEPVTGFVTGDVLLSGTANPPTAVVTPVSSTVYSVAVSGMDAAGTVIASVGAGVAIDVANNPNLASTSVDNTVQFDIADAPLSLNLPPNQTANNDPGQAGAIVAYPTVTATGGVPPVFVDCSPISGAFFPLGTTTVSCTASDSEGLFQEAFQDAIVFGTFTVTVVDNEPPVIADNPDLTRETVGNAPVAVSFGLPAASDNSGVPPTVVCTPASGSTFVVGTSTVTCTATDGAGNSASSSFTVTVTSTGSGVPGPTTVPPATTTPTTTNPIAGLPATGSDPQVLVLVALLLLAGGAVLVRGARRRTT
jgi:LPXTG-motif cell wall-anchored protein